MHWLLKIGLMSRLKSTLRSSDFGCAAKVPATTTATTAPAKIAAMEKVILPGLPKTDRLFVWFYAVRRFKQSGTGCQEVERSQAWDKRLNASFPALRHATYPPVPLPGSRPLHHGDCSPHRRGWAVSG